MHSVLNRFAVQEATLGIPENTLHCNATQPYLCYNVQTNRLF